MTPIGDQHSNEEVHPINLHLPGILQLLSEHLYSDPKVALRELIQNAHDSCQRRLVENPDPGYKPRIDIMLDPANHWFIIQDNGSGLTREEIQTYLATVGRGYTAELRDRLQFGGRKEALELIGQFGLGLLSAFIVADEIEMVTRSYQAGATAWRWVSAGEVTYRMAPAERESPGSIFKLRLKRAGEFLLNVNLVDRAIRTYADFLQIPIYLNRSPEHVNALNGPWHLTGASADTYSKFISDRFHVREPLAVIPLHHHVEALTHADGTTDQVVTPLSGVLFIPTGSVVSVKEYGDVTVYIRRMFITEDERDLLPRWAKFVRGVVESPILHPTVSREQVRRDDTFYRVQGVIEQQLITSFQKLAADDPAAWRNVVVAHNDLIKGWALESRTFFDSICDLVTFDTSRGRLTIQEYLDASGGEIYYFIDERGATQEKMLYEAQGLVVIDASRFAEEAFLSAYARTHPGVEIRQLEPDASFVFTEVKESSREWEYICRYFTEQGIDASVVKFDPVGIPAVLVYPPGSDHIAQAHAALGSGEISGPIAGLVEEYLRVRDPQNSATRGTLHLNAASPLMRHLLHLPPNSEAFTAALEIVYHNARFFAGRTLTAQEAKLGFDMISYSVEQLVRTVESASMRNTNDDV